MKNLLVLLTFFLATTAFAQEKTIGEHTTTYSYKRDHADRAANVERAATLINGYVLNPGEVFSYNQVVGKRTTENGFRVAHVIINGVLTDGMGGGACQPSSTLHAAALSAGLVVLERHPHSRASTYIGPGLDATVDFGRLDLKILNNQNAPITIFAETSTRGKLAIRLVISDFTKTTTTAILTTKIDKKVKPRTLRYKVAYLKPGEVKRIEGGTPLLSGSLTRVITGTGGDVITVTIPFFYPATPRIIHIGKQRD